MSEATRAKRPKPASEEVLTIKDVADRWGVSEGIIRNLVKSRGLPYFSPVADDMRIEWAYVRFRLEVIRQWEVEKSRAVPGHTTIEIPIDAEIAPKAKREKRDWWK